MMWNQRNPFILYFVISIVSVRCSVVDYNFPQYNPFQFAAQDDEYENINPEMMRYWKSGEIDPRRDAMYEKFFLLAHNCFRYVTTFEDYREKYPERFVNDKNNVEILRRAQISAVFYACENVIEIVVSYYQALENEGRPLPKFVLDVYE